MADRTPVLFPPGRLVWGSVYNPREKDAEGKPQLIKTGPNAGQPTKRWSFGVAIAKGSETHWNQTKWGSDIYNTAARAWPNGQFQAPSFAWKVTDGDSTVPNKAGKKPCDREGYRGCWVLAFDSSYAPQLYYRFGEKPLLVAAEPGRVVFASEMAPLSALGAAGRELDLEALCAIVDHAVDRQDHRRHP